MMLFAIGTKVELIHTGDVGRVEEYLDHGLVSVMLSDGEVIPVLQEALRRIESTAPSKVKAKFVPGKKRVEALPLQMLPTDSQYAILQPQGVQLAFDPVMRADNMPDYYRIFLINDTTRNFLYKLSLSLTKEEVWSTQGKLGPRTMIEAGNLKYNELNNSAVVHIEAWRLLPDGKGTGRRFSKDLKLKATQFFKKMTTAPYLNRKVSLYSLFSEKELDSVKKQVTTPQKESLKKYTSRETKKNSGAGKWFNLQQMPNEVWDMATFKNEIDLHIQSLLDEPEKLPKNRILSTQMQHFESFMSRAIQLGVDRVFIIHGLGEGKLKKAISKRLEEMHGVKSFTNEYHAKYGYGATEVLL